MHINIHELKNSRNNLVATNGTLQESTNNPITRVLLVVLGSFVLSSLPIIYGLTLTSSSIEAPTVPHEGILWNSESVTD